MTVSWSDFRLACHLMRYDYNNITNFIRSNCTTNHSYYNCWRLGSEISVGVNIASVAVNVMHLMVILSISLLSEKF